MRGYLHANPAADRRAWGILAARSRPDRREHPVLDRTGCGNGGVMETTDRFPQRLGNLAQTRDSHISTCRLLSCTGEDQNEDHTDDHHPRG